MIYLHIPWCRVLCPYCAFVVAVEADPPWQRFVDAALLDFERQSTEGVDLASTLYLGGGTPSLMPLPELQRLLAGIPRAPGAELTLEVNPGTVDRQRLREVLDLGVTRLSLGIQTFQRAHAQRLGRDHDVRAAERLLDDIAALPVPSWSLDLMFALPGQTLAELEADLDRVLDLGPPHVSLYGLTYEPGTAFHARRAQGRMQEVDEELWRAMYLRIAERLTGSGWQHYEISNFARPGHRSRHNEQIWQGGHYLGLGPGAHGYLPPAPAAPWGRRTVNGADIGAWMADPRPVVEVLDGRTWASDLLLSSLRHEAGVEVERLREAGFELSSSTVQVLVRGGLLEESEGRLRLSREGRLLGDGVTAKLIAGLRATDVG